MIKRFVLLILAAMTALTLFACSSAPAPSPSGEGAVQTANASAPIGTASPEPSASPESTQKPEDDTFYTVDFNDVYATTGIQQIFETEESVYYLCSLTQDTSIIYFSDKEYKDWMPLCSKPECMHTPKDNNCNAHIEGETSTKMWLYGRHIYYCSYYRDENELSLRRMKLDGSDHEKVLTFPMEAGSSFFWYFHNKYLFLDYTSLDAGSGEVRSTTYCVDLSEASPKAVKYELVDENGSPADFRRVVLGSGDKLFCLSNDEQNILYCIDIPSRTRRQICQLPYDPGYFSTALYGDTLQFCYGWDIGAVITVDVNTGEMKVLNEAEPQTMKWYMPYRHYIFGSNNSQSLNPALKGTAVYDDEGKPINDIAYETYNTDISISYIIGDYVFGYNYNSVESEYIKAPPAWYLDIREVGTDKLMWRRWAPEE